jgi:hypothetical protein
MYWRNEKNTRYESGKLMPGDLGVDGNVILNWIVEKYSYVLMVCTGFKWLMIGCMEGSYEHGNERLISIKARIP